MKELFKNKNYVFMMFSFMFLFGIYTNLGLVLSPLFLPYGYTIGEISIIGMVFITFGLIGTIVAGKVIDKTKKSLLTLRVVCASSAITLGLCALTVPTNELTYVLITICAAGFCVIPIITVCFSFAGELTYPIPPSLPNGIMMMFAQGFTFIMVFVSIGIINKFGSTWTMVLYSASAGLAFLFSTFISLDLKPVKQRNSS